MFEDIEDRLGRFMAAVRGSLKRLEESQKQITNALAAITERSSLSLPQRENYSPAEVARLLGKQPFTVREWCRLGRIKAKKRARGQGDATAWEISKEEIERVINHGLLPIPKRR